MWVGAEDSIRRLRNVGLMIEWPMGFELFLDAV
jgi:hypothetical protein